MLDPLKLNDLSHQRLAKFIQPSGYFNVKAQRLKNFIDYIVSRYQCDWDEFAAQPLDQLRDELAAQGWVVKDGSDGYEVVPA